MSERIYTIPFSKFLDRIGGLSDKEILHLLLSEALRNEAFKIDVSAAALPFEEANEEQIAFFESFMDNFESFMDN